MNDDRTPAWLLFALGLSGLLACQILSPAAWYLGNRYLRVSVRNRLEVDPLARVGRTLGVVGTLLWGTAALLGVVAGLIGFAWSR